MIHPILFAIFAQMSLYCADHELPFVLTRVIDEKIPGVSVSDTHGEGRAFDFSVKGWATDDIDDFVVHFNRSNINHNYGAFSFSDSNPRLVVCHDAGLGKHCHIQIRRNLPFDFEL